MRLAFVIVATACLLTPSLGAQWLRYPTAGLPRLADGKPDLQGAPRRLPDGALDLSGIWHVKAPNGGRYQQNIASDLPDVPFQPAALKRYEARLATQGRDHPRVRCLPRGIPNSMVWGGGPFKFIQTPGLTLILFEEFVTYRQVFTDGRSFPPDPQPAWWGYSIGKWSGDAFVVETTGFKEDAWLDFNGHPASEAMRITERIRRLSIGEMEIDFRFDDPKTYTRPWSVNVVFELLPDTEFIEHVCENLVTYERLPKP